MADLLVSPYSKGVNAASEWEYFEPLYVGDRLTGVSKLVGVEEKRTRLGDGAFFYYESSYLKETGELVAVNRNTLYSFDPDEGARPGEPEEQDSSLAAGAGDEPLLSDSSGEQTEWGAGLSVADVTKGAEAAPYAVQLTYQRIVMGVAADRMFASIHHNRDAARAAGLDDIIFNTRGIETLQEIGLRRWMGLGGRIRRLGPFRMRSNLYPGDLAQVRLLVTDVEEQPPGGRVQVKIEIFSQRGTAVTGEAMVELPQ